MDSDSRSYWIVTIVLLVFAAFFALSETAVSAASRSKIRTKAEKGDPRARKAQKVLLDFEGAVTTLLICTNIVHILLASLVTTMVTRKWGLGAVSVSTVITTIVVFFAGEMLPKSVAKKKPETFTLAVSGVLLVLMKLLSPLSRLLSGIGRFVSDHLADEKELSVTEEEIQDIIEDCTEDGKMDSEQAELLSQALVFAKKKARDIMTPAPEVHAIDNAWSPEEKFGFIKNENHSRIPVYRESMDQCIGMLSVRKYYRAWYRSGKYPALVPLLSKVYYAAPDTDIDELLDRMSAEKVTMAVIREKEKTVGIITVEDILEELVGDIYDENDREPEVKRV